MVGEGKPAGAVASSSGLAPDGKPLLEVTRAVAGNGQLILEGTACAYEGNVMLHLRGEEHPARVLSTQASAGGPERGTWRITIDLSPGATVLSIGDEDAANGGLSHLSLVTLRVDAEQNDVVAT